MGSLKFTVGPVASGKTVDLILKANQLQTVESCREVLVLKPTIDTRFNQDVVRSASGLQIKVTALVSPADDMLEMDLSGVNHIIIDEIQFFTIKQIEQLRTISLRQNIEVHCYGLLSDFKTFMFDASKRLLELCDEFHSVKTYCLMCRHTGNNQIPGLASQSLRIRKQGDTIKAVVEGESVCIGGIETFLPVCFQCYYKTTGTFM